MIYISVEHAGILAMVAMDTQYCTNSTEIKYYFQMAWKQVYSDDNYDGGVRGFLIEYLNCYCSIQANYMDIFTIAICMCLSNRFKQLNSHLEHFKGMVMNNENGPFRFLLILSCFLKMMVI